MTLFALSGYAAGRALKAAVPYFESFDVSLSACAGAAAAKTSAAANTVSWIAFLIESSPVDQTVVEKTCSSEGYFTPNRGTAAGGVHLLKDGITTSTFGTRVVAGTSVTVAVALRPDPSLAVAWTTTLREEATARGAA